MDIVLLINLAVLIAVGYMGYKLICNFIIRHSGCTQRDIEDEIWGRLNKRNPNPITNIVFTNKACNIIQIVLGEQRYKNLCNIAATGYSIANFISTDICYLNILAPYDTDKEKEQFETMLLDALKQYLSSQGIVSDVLVHWGEHNILKLPYIQFRYASNLRQKQALKQQINEKISKNVNNLSTKPPVDDEEDDIL